MLKIISLYLGIVIMAIGEIIFARIVLNKKIEISKLKLSIIFILTTILLSITTIYLNGIIKTLILFIIHILEFKFLFNIEMTKTLFLTVMYSISLIIIDICYSLFATIILRISNDIYYNEIAGNLISNLIVCIMFVGLTLILRNPLRKLINLKIENTIKITIFSILVFICFLIVGYTAFSDIKVGYNLVISIFTMIIFVLILLSLIKQTVENSNLTKRYEQILDFMSIYEEEVERQRVLRHETKNAFITIKGQITDESKGKEIIKYIDSILKDDVKIKNEEYAKFKDLPSNGIKGLCYYKMQEAENKGLKISISISSNIKKSILYRLKTKDIKDIAKLLGIYIDNAIEAALETEEKSIGLEIYYMKDIVKIMVSNTFKDGIDLEKIGNGYTSKGKNRGHGLLLAKSIISTNKMFNHETNIVDNVFTQKIIIKEPIK